MELKNSTHRLKQLQDASERVQKEAKQRAKAAEKAGNLYGEYLDAETTKGNPTLKAFAKIDPMAKDTQLQGMRDMYGQQNLNEYQKYLQKVQRGAWASLPTVQDSEKFHAFTQLEDPKTAYTEARQKQIEKALPTLQHDQQSGYNRTQQIRHAQLEAQNETILKDSTENQIAYLEALADVDALTDAEKKNYKKLRKMLVQEAWKEFKNGNEARSNELDVLNMALSDKARNAAEAGIIGAADALTFGMLGKVTGETKKQAADLTQDQNVKQALQYSPTQWAQATHPKAYGVGSIAGSVAAMTGLGMAEGQILNGIKGFESLDKVVKSMIQSSTLFGSDAFLRSAAKQEWDEDFKTAIGNVAFDTASATASGIVAGALGGLTGQALDKWLRANNLWNNAVAVNVARSISSTASAVGRTAAQEGYNALWAWGMDEDYDPKWVDIGTSAMVAGLTTFVLGMINSSAETKASKARLEQLQREYAAKFTALQKGATTEEQAARNVLEMAKIAAETNQLLTNNQFVGQQKLVEAAQNSTTANLETLHGIWGRFSPEAQQAALDAFQAERGGNIAEYFQVSKGAPTAQPMPGLLPEATGATAPEPAAEPTSAAAAPGMAPEATTPLPGQNAPQMGASLPTGAELAAAAQQQAAAAAQAGNLAAAATQEAPPAATEMAAAAPEQPEITPTTPETRAPEQSLQDARALRDEGVTEAQVLQQTGWVPLSGDTYLNPSTGEQVNFDGETVTVYNKNTAGAAQKTQTTETMTGGTDNAEQTGESGNVLYDRGSKRNDGARAGEQAGRMGEGTTATETGKAGADAGAERIYLKNRLKELNIPQTPAKDLGIQNATERPVTLVPQKEETNELKRIRDKIKTEYGVADENISFVFGRFELRTGKSGQTTRAEAVVVGGHMYVSVDDFSKAEKLAVHEAYHIADGREHALTQKNVQALKKSMGEKEYEKLVADYMLAYDGIYGMRDEDIIRYQAEVCADAAAGLNRRNRHTGKRMGANALHDQIDTGVRSRQTSEASRRMGEGESQAAQQYSVNTGFKAELDAWQKDGRPEGAAFVLGSTGDTLQGLGAIESDIYMNADKINLILQKHPEMTIREIQRIPEILDDPVLILKSKNNARSQYGNSRLVMFGAIKAQDGRNIMCVLDLRPTENGLLIDDMQKVSSAYSKDVAPENFIKRSFILFADEKRTIPLLRGMGFKMPMSLLRSGSIGSISYEGKSVNLRGEKFADVVVESEGPAHALKLPSVNDEAFSLEEDNAEYDENIAIQQHYEQSLEEEGKRAREEAEIEEEALWGARMQQAESAHKTNTERRWESLLEQAERTSERAGMRRQEEPGERGKITRATARELQKAEEKQARSELAEKKIPRTAIQSLHTNLQNIFSTAAGDKAEVNELVDAFAARIAKKGEITARERDEFFDKLYATGTVTQQAESQMQEGREALRGGKIYVPEEVRAELGKEEWNEIRKRAFANGIYLVKDEQEPGIETWNAQLAEDMPGVFDKENTDAVMILNDMIDMAEAGKDQHMTLEEYANSVGATDYGGVDAFLDEIEKKMDWALETFAKEADIAYSVQPRTRGGQERFEQLSAAARAREKIKQAEIREKRIEAAKRKRQQEELRDLQQRTLKALQWLNRNRNCAPEELKATFDETLEDIDLYAVGAANELNWSTKRQATWKDLAQMYQDARENDPNFLPSKELETIVSRLNDQKIAEMDIDALRNLYKAAVGLRTEFYNRKNMVGSMTHQLFDEVFKDSVKEIEAAPKGYTGKGFDKFMNMEQLSAINVMERMAGWNPNSTWYKTAKQLEKGERDMRAYTVEASKLLAGFLTKNAEWVKRADGQGKDAIWYKVEIPELIKYDESGKAVFSDEKVTVYMTPSQKVELFLESKNYDNLRHMEGGRTFADPKLYASGKRGEALAQGTTIRLAPETVKALVRDLTGEEKELADILWNYYNVFSREKINSVSNVLLGYDKATVRNYAPIFTNSNYNAKELGKFEATAEGIGSLHERTRSKNPSLNIGAFDAFERSVEQTARYVGMAIPARNWQTLLNWQGETTSMRQSISSKWGAESIRYIENQIQALQGGTESTRDSVSGLMNTVFSHYIGAVFGANPSIVFKQLGSIPLASAWLGGRNLPSPRQIAKIDRNLIAKYTQELDYRTMGYSTPETKQLKDHPTKLQTNKVTNFALGGGAITAMDGWAASVLWPWAENKVAKEHPKLERGTKEQIESGQSEFYKKVAEEFNEAVARSQSTSDEMHQGTLRKSSNPIARMFTMFKSDSSQTYNALRQMAGEAAYYKRAGDKENQKKAMRKLGTAIIAAAGGYLWAEFIEFLMNLWKHKGKRYRDDGGELTAASVAKEMTVGLVGDMAGIVNGGEEITEAVGSLVLGNTWDGINTQGLEAFSDLVDLSMKTAKSTGTAVKNVLYLARNGGDVEEYLRMNSGEIIGSVKEIAQNAATYIPGLPVNNLEAYILGTIRWASPELAQAYQDALKNVEKSDLSKMSGKALEQGISDVYERRSVTLKKETAAELARLYNEGFTGAIVSSIPDKVTVDKEDKELDILQQQTYQKAWQEFVVEELEKLIASDKYANASDEEREKYLKKLYTYANEEALAASVEGYELSSGHEKVKHITDMGDDFSMVYDRQVEGSWERYVKLRDADVTEQAAETLSTALFKAEQENGKDKNLTDVEKYKIILDADIQKADKENAVKTVVSKTMAEKLDKIGKYGVNYADYAEFKIKFERKFPGESMSQARAEEIITNMSLTAQERAALWQVVTNTKKGDSNPYMVIVGEHVVRLLDWDQE